MSPAIDAELGLLAWPAAELGAAVQALAQTTGLAPHEPEQAPRRPHGEDLSGWLASAGARLGVEVVEVETSCGELEDMLRRLGPALLRVGAGAGAVHLAVVSGGRRWVSVLGPDRVVRRVGVGRLRDAWIGGLMAPALAATRELIAGLGLDGAAGEVGARALARERLHAEVVGGCWLVRTAPANPPERQLAATRMPLLLALMLAVRAGQVGLTLGLWWFIGGAVVTGELSASAVGGAAMCLISQVPLAILDAWTQGRLALEAGAQLKEALLYGVLRLDRGVARASGVGRFMSMALEGEVASTAIESALRLVASGIDLSAAVVVLLLGAAGDVLAMLLVAWIGLVVWLCRRHAIAAERWAVAYRDVTHDLVERMVGYQTRLIQEPPELRHLDEDALLRTYLEASRSVDGNSLVIGGLLRTGWLLLGLAALAPALLAGRAGPATAVAFGGVLLVAGALQRVVGGVTHLIDVRVSWQQTAPLLRAGRDGWQRDVAVASKAPARAERADAGPLLEFAGLTVRHAAGRADALRGCSGAIAAGDRVLLSGPSGGGKSTLATVLAGLREPDGGDLRLLGRRRAAVTGDRWRRRVVLVPQFHDNHVLSESLLFNLLFGRRWPPTAEDVRDAGAVCERLGLAPLVERMPLGLQQMVGDGGWALSHGERSRVFLARALLQRDVALVILDESLAALDPETLREVGRGVLASAPTLLVIAHP